MRNLIHSYQNVYILFNNNSKSIFWHIWSIDSGRALRIPVFSFSGHGVDGNRTLDFNGW